MRTGFENRDPSNCPFVEDELVESSIADKLNRPPHCRDDGHSSQESFHEHDSHGSSVDGPIDGLAVVMNGDPALGSESVIQNADQLVDRRWESLFEPPNCVLCESNFHHNYLRY